jgi:hypothetical protein
MDDFWRLVDEARRDVKDSELMDDEIAENLINRLATGPVEEILDFANCFDHASSRAFDWTLWAAAELIWGWTSDDTFTGFRSGLIGLGRETFERVVADPDSLADHPLVQRIARGEVRTDALYMEALENVASHAYERVTGDEDDGFWDAIDEHDTPLGDDEHSEGERFDLNDPAEVRRRLPRLTALFPSQSKTIR